MAGGTRGQIVDDRFELLDQLGHGGMGTVWRARDTALHREVALKEVRPADPASTPEGSEASRMLRERVLREARALARLNDPHVVTIHHIVDDGPYPWLVMELLPGSTLQDRLAAGPLTPRDAARIGGEVLSALRTAHAAGIQHRDVKPANVLLRANGSAVLTDFGIAALQGSATLTATGEFLGSPEFMAPERIRGVGEDPSSDLWSLGMMLYVCTEGHSPLRRATSLATLAAVLDEPVPPPVRSRELVPVLKTLLVRDQEARPDEEQLAQMLADVAEGRYSDAYLPTATAVPPRPPFSAPPTPRPPVQPATGFGPASGTPGTPYGPYGAGARGGSPGGAGGSGRTARFALAAVAAVALVAGAAYGLVRVTESGGGTHEEARGGSDGGGATMSPTADTPGPAVPPDRGTTTPAETPKTPRTPTAAPTTPRKPPAAPSVRGSAHADSWVAQLGSVAKSAGKKERTERHRALLRETQGVLWLNSDDYASLRPGYWVFYRPGSRPLSDKAFKNGHAAADWCTRQGLATTNRCLGRYLSDDRDDSRYLCAPDRSRGTGRCERD